MAQKVTSKQRQGGFYIGTISGATLGTTGNKAITGVGFTPKMVRFSSLPTSSTGATNTALGAMTASSQYVVLNATDTSTGRGRYSSTSYCIGLVGPGSSTPFLLASYVSMDADGFTINVATASSAFDIAYECYG